MAEAKPLASSQVCIHRRMCPQAACTWRGQQHPPSRPPRAFWLCSGDLRLRDPPSACSRHTSCLALSATWTSARAPGAVRHWTGRRVWVQRDRDRVVRGAAPELPTSAPLPLSGPSKRIRPSRGNMCSDTLPLHVPASYHDAPCRSLWMGGVMTRPVRS